MPTEPVGREAKAQSGPPRTQRKTMRDAFRSTAAGGRIRICPQPGSVLHLSSVRWSSRDGIGVGQTLLEGG